MLDIAGELRVSSFVMFSSGPLHTAEQQGVAWKTYWERWTIGMRGGRGSGKSVKAVCHDDDLEKYDEYKAFLSRCKFKQISIV